MLNRNTHAFLLATMLLAESASANPFPEADVTKGKAYHEELCVACHTRRFGGEEGGNVYLRENRRAKNPEGLRQMLSACTSALNLDLFPEDEAHIAGYLNQRFYRFGLK